MDGSHTRRRLLAAAGVAAGSALGGCLGGDDEDDEPAETLDFTPIESIDRRDLPDTSQYATDDGSVRQYRRYRADVDRVLVFVHGCGLDSGYLEPLGRYLADAQIADVFTPGLRGHGPDPERRGDVDHIGHLEEDVNDLFGVIRELHPDAPVIVGGHGFGAGTAVRFAARTEPDQVAGYLLVSPYLGRDAPTTRSAFGGLVSIDRDWTLVLDLLNGFGIRRFNDRPVLDIDLPEAVRDGTETDTYTYRMDASFSPEGDVYGLSALSDRTAILVGTDDEAIAADRFEGLLDDIADHEDVEEPPEIHLQTLEGLTHYEPIVDDRAHEWIGEWLTTF